MTAEWVGQKSSSSLTLNRAGLPDCQAGPLYLAYLWRQVERCCIASPTALHAAADPYRDSGLGCPALLRRPVPPAQPALDMEDRVATSWLHSFIIGVSAVFTLSLSGIPELGEKCKILGWPGHVCFTAVYQLKPQIGDCQVGCDNHGQTILRWENRISLF